MADSSLWPLVIYFTSVLVIVAVILTLSSLLGQKSKMTRATAEPFESGVVHIGSTQIPVSAEFFLIAICFVIFDLETIFIFAWAIAFHELGLFGYWAASVFILILLVALVYEWKTGALEWGKKIRTGLPKNYSLEPAED